jgi:hypothetical protein
VVNWNINVGGSVDNFPGADAFPGIGVNTVNFTEEVITYIELPTAGTYTMGVNSDDGFGVSAAALNPKDPSTGISVGKYDSTRGAGDTVFQFSVTQAGIYPFRLVYFQVGGGASVTWFSVSSDGTTTNMINDVSSPSALKAYATATVAPPYAGGFVSSPAGFSFKITDDVSALDPSSLQVALNGNPVTVTNSKSGSVTTVSYVPPTLFQSGSSNTVTTQFKDNASPAHTLNGTFAFIVPNYTAMPNSAALPASAVDTTKQGFLFRVSQIDSTSYGVLAANNAHAEAQLAGLLKDPASGTPYPNSATAGPQPDGSYVVTNINFSYDTTAEQGAFSSANGHPDSAYPGITGGDSGNMAGEIIAYLDLKPGFYTFAVNATDGFRVTTGANPRDALGTMLGLFDYRAITTETTFGVAVQNAGIYPIRLVWYRVAKGSDNGTSEASLEFYTIDNQGTKVLVNDNSAGAVKAYYQRTAGFAPYLRYAGPSSFVSPFGDSADVGFQTATVVISDGSSNTVDPASIAWTIDGAPITATPASANGLTTLSYTPTDLQLPRTTHAATLAFSAAGGGAPQSASWNFHLMRNYVVPAPLYFEDFESTAAGPDPTVPTGWVQENFTGHQTAGNDQTDLNSDFYLGWVVVDKSFDISKDFGVSSYAPQELNGSFFDETTNALLVNHYIRAESDSRQNGPPGQIQYLTTKGYDFTGKTGIVIGFDSSFEQNQDSINGLEYTVDGTNYNPVFYWIQGDFDSQGPADTLRDGLGNIDVIKTMMTSYSDVAQYTDPNTQQLVGGYYGFFLKAPITQALAPYIEGRYNDDGNESKRIELYRVPLADNQSNVKFRFLQAGTSSWYWAIDNWAIYSVPTSSAQPPGDLSINLTAGKVIISWTGPGTLQSASAITGQWTDVTNSPTSPVSITPTTGNQFYRLRR